MKHAEKQRQHRGKLIVGLAGQHGPPTVPSLPPPNSALGPPKKLSTWSAESQNCNGQNCDAQGDKPRTRKRKRARARARELTARAMKVPTATMDTLCK